MFASRPLTMSSGHLVFRRTTWSDSKDSKCRNYNSTGSQNPSSFLVWKTRFKNQVTTCSDFPSQAMLWIKEDQMEQEILTQLPLAEVQANEERQGNLLQNYERRIQKTTRRPEVIQIVLRSKFEFGRSWTILLCSTVTEWSEESIFVPRIHVVSR